MKKLFHKISKIMIIAGMAALIILVLTMACSEGDTIEGFWGGVGILCILVILIFAVFAAVSVVLAIWDGWKKDKKGLLKKFASNIVAITIVYAGIYALDYFFQEELAIEFNLGSLLLRIFVTALAIFGGEYMFADHSKDDELYF